VPVGVHTEVVGVKETIKALRRVDPEFRKEFNRAAKAIVAPMVAEAKGLYPQLPLSGMARFWSQNGASKFPWDVRKVRAGVKVKTSTRRDKNSVLYVSQGNPAGAIFEVAGTKTPGAPFNASLRARSDRVLWPTFDRHAPQIQAGVALLVKKAEKTVQGMVD